MAIDFFFYGTLRDAGVRRIVFGPGESAETAEPATLEGYRCAPVERGRFPAIVAQRGAETPGVLVRGVSFDAAARVSFFEDDGSYYRVALEPLSIAGGRSAAAWVYIATAALPLEAGQWSFDIWRRHWRPEFLATARVAMAAAAREELSRCRQAWLGRLSPAPGAQSPCS